MAGLRHPGIVSVIEPKGEEDGYLYVVLEYLPGGDFGRAVRQNTVGGVEALRVLLVAGDALAYAHARGFVHRDVKPDNILLDRVGGPRLTDFDLVRGVETTGGTLTGAGLGTFLYAAPEARLDAATAGPAADVYSLGMTALFVLCGGDLPPRAGSRPEDVIDALATGTAIRRAVARAVAFEPGRRPPSVEAFCDALAEALDAGEPASVRPPDVGPTEPAPVALAFVMSGSNSATASWRIICLSRSCAGDGRVLGATGSGLAAVLRVAAGRLRPTLGDVTLHGMPMDAAEVGFVAEDVFLWT